MSTGTGKRTESVLTPFTEARSFLTFAAYWFFELTVVTVFWGVFLLLCFMIVRGLARLVGM